ncbi:MAG: FAD-binding oxidoreductase [bacterium]
MEATLKDIAGAGNVSDEAAVLEAYGGDLSFVGRVRPRFVVRATSAGAIQKLVDLARETVTPLVPVSSGAPHFYGDTVPATGDAVVLDLSGMKKIDLVQRIGRVAVFEPGVTFGELIPAVAEEGLRLNMPLQPRATKSVVGSMLSREPVIMPHYHWDISDPIGSTEVVFGTGEMFRTGSASNPGTIEEQRKAGGVQKEAAGPSANSWHRILQGAQGTMGIVTWASARCELLPELEQPYFIGSADLAKLLETIHWLVRLRLGNECLILNSIDVAALVASDDPGYAQSVAELPPWILFFNLAAYDYLPEQRMAGQLQDTKELLERIGVDAVQSLGGIASGEFMEAIRRPSAEPYWKLRQHGGCQDIFFLTTYAKIPGQVRVMTEAAEAVGLAPTKIGVYLQPIVQGSNCHCEFNLFYDPEDQTESQVVRGLATSVVQPLMAAGAFFSRPFGEAAREIMNRDAANVEALRKVKAIVDPAGILNPGKLCF